MACKKKKLSQKHDPPPEKKNTARDKGGIETQSPPKRTHGIVVKNPINLKTMMPNVGYAFEYFHRYNEIQTVLTTVSAQCEDQTVESLRLTSVTDGSFWTHCEGQYSECSEYIYTRLFLMLSTSQGEKKSREAKVPEFATLDACAERDERRYKYSFSTACCKVTKVSLYWNYTRRVENSRSLFLKGG